MCTTIRFLGWAPGSRVPLQSPTIERVTCAIVRAGTMPNANISVNPAKSANDEARGFFMVEPPLARLPLQTTILRPLVMDCPVNECKASVAHDKCGSFSKGYVRLEPPP